MRVDAHIIRTWTKQFPTPDEAKQQALKDLFYRKEMSIRQYDHLIQMILEDK